MLAAMAPRLDPGRYVFCALPDPPPDFWTALRPLAAFVEREGLSLILGAETARARALDGGPPMRRITLDVRSSLEGVGLTAAVSAALAEAQIPCNVVAALNHDHLFVPEPLAARALDALARLQAEARAAAR